MYRYCKHLALTIGLMVAATLGLSAQQFVYVLTGNSPTNTVRAYSVSSGGALTEIAGSPFSTGGAGGGGSLFAADRLSVYVVGNYLFAANQGSNTVSAFSINPVTGALTAAAGSPFAAAGSAGSSMSIEGVSNFLYVTNTDSELLTIYTIGAGGVLSQIGSSPFALPDEPSNVVATPNGQYLLVSFRSNNSIGVYSIGAGGALTAVSGSPFGVGDTRGMDINSSGTFVFGGDPSTINTSVNVASIASNGSLSSITGSPFTTSDADNSNVVILSPDESYLFVSNQFSNEITVFSVASNGSLTQISGSPFSGGLSTPMQMATNYDGTLLYVNNDDGTLSVFSVAANGSLSAVTGSPFTVGSSSVPGVAAFPSLLPDQRLPVELSGFSLSASNNTVRLAWRTASETENVGFEVQRADGQEKSFRTIASYLNHPSLSGLGTSAIGQNYNFTDAELQPGEYLYRLIDVSTEGARTVHPAKLIRVESNEQLTTAGSMRLHPIAPNPVADELAISFALPEEQSVRVDIYTTDGKRISSPISGMSYGAGNHTESVSTEGMPAGSYVVMLSAGIQVRTQRFVVVR